MLGRADEGGIVGLLDGLLLESHWKYPHTPFGRFTLTALHYVHIYAYVRRSLDQK